MGGEPAPSLKTRIWPVASASRIWAFLILGSLDRFGDEVDLDLALTSCMPILELIRRVVTLNFEMDEASSLISASSCANDRVDLSASFIRSALKYDLAIIAAHNAQLVPIKFNAVTAHSSAPVDELVSNTLITPSPPRPGPPSPFNYIPVILGNATL